MYYEQVVKFLTCMHGDFVKNLCETAVNLLTGSIEISSWSIRSLLQEMFRGRMNQKVELKDLARNSKFW